MKEIKKSSAAMIRKTVGGLNQEALWKRLGEIAFELDEIEKQLGGLYNLKKKKQDEIRKIKDLLVEDARNRKE